MSTASDDWGGNCALFYDEALADVAAVTEGHSVAGPSFLYSLASLVEAAVLHERVYFDVRPDDRGSGFFTLMREASLVNDLMKEGVLCRLPPDEVMDRRFAQRCVDYSRADLLSDLFWDLRSSFLLRDTTAEVKRYQVLLELTTQTPTLFNGEDPVDADGELVLGSVAAARAMQMGYSLVDLEIVGGWNHRAKGYVEFANHSELNLCPALSAMPHHLGGVGATNRQARRLYAEINSRITAADEAPPDGAEFERVAMPPLCQLALKHCKGDPRAIADAILELRRKHSAFRNYLTNFDIAWIQARSRDERGTLSKDFHNALHSLVTRDERPSMRLIYTIWDVLKKPTEILSALGDKIAGEGRELSVVNRVSGLHDFWIDLRGSPVPEQNVKLLSQTFNTDLDVRLWDAASRFVAATNEATNQFVGRAT